MTGQCDGKRKDHVQILLNWMPGCGPLPHQRRWGCLNVTWTDTLRSGPSAVLWVVSMLTECKGNHPTGAGRSLASGQKPSFLPSTAAEAHTQYLAILQVVTGF